MGQNNDAAIPQASTDARALLATQEKGFSADCLFQSWPKDRQLNAYRELNNVQDTSGVHALTLSFDNTGRHLVSRDHNENAACAPQEASAGKRASQPAPEKAKQVDRSSRVGDRTENPYETERLAHPERPAEKIENLAKRAMDGDERAKLDLRKAVADLSEQPREFREKVLQKMVDDGTYVANPFNGKPHVVITKGENGKPESITFSQNLGYNKQEIPLNQTFDQQVDTAQKNYKNALQQVVGGLGKFDTEATMKAMEILDGAQPTDNLKWFMLARKDQGRQPVDQ